MNLSSRPPEYSQPRQKTELYIRPHIKKRLTTNRIVLVVIVLAVFALTQGEAFSHANYFYLNWGGKTHGKIRIPPLNLF